MNRKKCNLCHEEYPVDDVWESRKTQHERFHKNSRKEKRNTIEGTVIWIDT